MNKCEIVPLEVYLEIEAEFPGKTIVYDATYPDSRDLKSAISEWCQLNVNGNFQAASFYDIEKRKKYPECISYWYRFVEYTQFVIINNIQSGRTEEQVVNRKE
jgi:hypothetical protein